MIDYFNKCQLLNFFPSSLPAPVPPSLSSPFLSDAKVIVVWLLNLSPSFSLLSPETSLVPVLLCQITVTQGKSLTA